VNHRVYVGDPGANRIGRIEEFDSAGTFVATVTPPISPGALAVDGSNGDLWITDSGQIARLRSDGTLINQFSAVNGFPREIAVDSGQHAVWVRTAQFTIKEYSSAGALLRTVGGVDSTGRPTLFGNVSGLGVDPATGQLYVADIAGNVPHPDGGSKRVLVFDSTGQFIRKFDTLNDNGNFSTALSISPATGNVFITSSDATVNVFSKSGTFLYRFVPDRAPAPISDNEGLPGTLALAPSGDIYVPVDLTSRIQIDHYREAIAPVVDSGGAGAVSNAGPTSAHASGTVNPEGSATTYHFEYFSARQSPDSPDRQPASASSDPSLPADTSSDPVSRDLGGSGSSAPLTPSTQYYWRLVATNAVGTTNGSVHGPFTTPAAGGAGSSSPLTLSVSGDGSSTPTLRGGGADPSSNVAITVTEPNGTNFKLSAGSDGQGNYSYTISASLGLPPGSYTAQAAEATHSSPAVTFTIGSSGGSTTPPPPAGLRGLDDPTIPAGLRGLDDPTTPAELRGPPELGRQPGLRDPERRWASGEAHDRRALPGRQFQHAGLGEPPADVSLLQRVPGADRLGLLAQRRAGWRRRDRLPHHRDGLERQYVDGRRHQ